MDSTWGAAVAAAGAIPGFLALGSVLVGWGRLTERLKTVEREIADARAILSKVGVIEERTKNTADNVQAIRDGFDQLSATVIERAFGELRSFRPAKPD